MSLKSKAAKLRKAIQQRRGAKKRRADEKRREAAAAAAKRSELDASVLRGRAGQSLGGDWTRDPDLAAVRKMYREFKSLPRANPLRRAIDEWEEDREKTEFPVPERWHPSYVVVQQ